MQVHKTAVLNHAPEIGIGTSIGEFCVIQNYGSLVKIGQNCDIAARVSINCSDSHRQCIGLADGIEYLPIIIEDHVYIGEGAIILGGCAIRHHSVIGAGVVLAKNTMIPPYSLVIGDYKREWITYSQGGTSLGAQIKGPTIREGYYANRLSNKD